MAKARYRLTPARKAAILKAQKISARKRRRHQARAVAGVVGSIVGTAAISYATRSLSNPRQGIKDAQDLHAFAKRKFGKGPKVDPNAPGVPTRRNSKPLRYWGTPHSHRINAGRAVHGSRLRSRVR